MTDKVISTENDFEDIQLNLDDFGSSKKTPEPEEVLKLDSLESPIETKVNPSIDKKTLQDIPIKQEVIESLDDINLDDLDIPSASVVSTDNLKDDIKNKLPIDNQIEDLEIGTEKINVEISKIIDKPITSTIENAKDIIPTPSEHPKKRGRPAKKVESVIESSKSNSKETISQVVDKQIEILQTEQAKNVIEKIVDPSKKVEACYLDPLFPISKISTGKYQQRQTQRTVDQMRDLVEKIKLQGQLVAVQIVKEDNEFQLMDGFGRFNAIQSLGISTIKAIIYEGINKDEIYKIVSGSNLGRAELSEWDKIWSIGKFWEDNVEKYEKEDLCKIFGISKSTLYMSLEYYDIFSRDSFLVNLFKTNSVKYFIYDSITKFLKKYPLVKLENLHSFIKSKIENSNTTKEKFENACIVTFEMITRENTIVPEDLNTEIILDDSEAQRFTQPILNKDLKLQPEKMDIKIKIVIESYMDNILKCLKKIQENIAGIKAITNHGDFVNASVINKTSEKLDIVKADILKLI